jgi:hypothetical protein
MDLQGIFIPKLVIFDFYSINGLQIGEKWRFFETKKGNRKHMSSIIRFRST